MSASSGAVVIGTGFGGLASALRLRKLGHDVTVLERCHQPGGRAQTFTLGGTPFDAGPTVITAPYLFSELFEMFGKNISDYVEIKPLEPVWYRYNFKNGFEFDYGRGDFFLEQLQQNFPQEVDGYQRLYKHAEKIFDLGYEKLADVPFHKIGFMLKQIPAILRFNGYQSVYGLVRKYIKSPELVQALCTPPLLLGGNPKTASSIYFLIHILEQKYGVHYAMGGTGRLVRSLCELAQEEGYDCDGR